MNISWERHARLRLCVCVCVCVCLGGCAVCEREAFVNNDEKTYTVSEYIAKHDFCTADTTIDSTTCIYYFLDSITWKYTTVIIPSCGWSSSRSLLMLVIILFL